MKGRLIKVIVTRKYIEYLREKSFIQISQKAEKLILEKFGKEPESNESYTEQDILEHIRKIIQDN